MFAENIRIAIASLKATRTRTVLTTLGVLIGVGSIALVWAIGEGAKRAINEQIGQVGGDYITVRPGKLDRANDGVITGYDFNAAVGTTTLTERDLKTIEDIEGVEAAAPVMLITGSIKTENKRPTGTTLIATSPDFNETQALKPHAGQFIETTTDRETTVIGYDLSLELFGTDDALGRQITLRGEPFTVIGVLKKVEQPINIGGFNYNRSAFVSLDAGKAFNHGIPQIQQIIVHLKDQRQAAPVASNIHGALLKNHGGEEDFAVIRANEATQITDGVFRTLIGITSAIASISLVVGGIGIMNIMLVSVTERTREIGIRKAIGATNRQILSQFLIEAIVISVVGGILGLMTAALIALLASPFISFTPVVTPLIIAVSLSVAIVVGVVFGLFPAVKAARKDPITALRQLP